jgi:hypothetical protein
METHYMEDVQFPQQHAKNAARTRASASQPICCLLVFSSWGAQKISLSRSKAPTTIALSATLKAGQWWEPT